MNDSTTNQKKSVVKIKKSLVAVFAVLFAAVAVACAFFAVSYFSAESENKTLRSNITALDKQLDDMESQVAELTSQSEEMSKILDRLQGAEQESSELATRLETISDAMKLLESEKATLTASLTEIQAQKTAIEEQYKLSEAEKDKKYAELDAKYNSLLSSYDSVNAKYKEIQDKFNALAIQLKALDYIESAEGYDDHSGIDKVCYLTFDDGPSITNTTKILDILKANGIKATFFVNKRGSSYNAIYKRIVNEGHTIGNHTASHQYGDVYTSLQGFMEQFDDLQQHVYKVTGVYPQIFRFPGGSGNTVHKKYNTSIMPDAVKALGQIGVNYYDWNVNSTDANVALQSVENIISASTNVKNKKRVILLMHDSEGKTTTPEALPEVIRILKEKGYEFRALNGNVTPIQSKLS